MNDKNKPLVHILILNWNAQAVTAECLQSLRRLIYPNYQITLIDNGSDDRSGEILAARFPEVHLLQLAHNRGFAGGNNMGMKRALDHDATYILLLNNDTVAAPDFLDQLVEVAESDRTIAVVNPKILFTHPPDRIWYAAGTYNWWLGMPFYHSRQKDMNLPDHPQPITFATGCAMLLRAKALREVGLFDERFFAYGEDNDLTARMLKAGYRAMYVPSAVVWHKDGFTIKSQQGIAYKVYLTTRNRLLQMAKHARPWQWMVFLPCFGLRHVLYYMLLGLLRRNWQMAYAPITGIRDFFRLISDSKSVGINNEQK